MPRGQVSLVRRTDQKASCLWRHSLRLRCLVPIYACLVVCRQQFLESSQAPCQRLVCGPAETAALFQSAKIHACMRTYTCTYLFTNIQTDIHLYLHACLLFVHAHAHAYNFMCIYINAQTRLLLSDSYPSAFFGPTWISEARGPLIR